MSEEDSAFKKVEWDGDQYRPADDDLDELPTLPRRSLAPEDRELLKLAALAIGCVRFEEVEGEGWVNLYFADGSVLNAWNPLVHSDDAFELAVKLGMQVHINRDPAGYSACAVLQSVLSGARTFTENGDSGLEAATRRAITRAAAEMGKKTLR